MPVVPEYNDFKVMQSTMPDQKLNQPMTPGMASMAGDQMKQFGDNLQSAGQKATSIEVDAAEQANQLRVIDAENSARQSALDLANNPETGYLQLKGKDALNRPNGQALPEEYGTKLTDTINQVSGTLSNPMQQRMFHERAAEIMTQFQSGVQQHLLQQHEQFGTSVLTGAKDLATQQASAAGITNPTVTAQAIDTIKTANAGLQKFNGLSANETQAKTAEDVSAVHVTAIKSALINNDYQGATAYYNKALSAGELTGKDILLAQPAIMEKQDQVGGMKAVGASLSKYQPQFTPNEFDRAVAATSWGENRGRGDFEKDGVTPLTSPKGAKYAMQVEPATAANPGYGIKPAASDTPDEYNRVGRELLNAMLKKYDDPRQAFAAYNAGTGPVDKAIAETKGQGQDAWMTKLPAETQAYVKTVNDSYQSGSSIPQPPTKSAFVNDALQRLGDNPRPTAVAIAREQAEKQYDLQVASRKELADQALTVAQQQLNQNGGSFTTLPQETRSNLVRYDPGKVDDAMKYAKVIAEGEGATDPALYARLTTTPMLMTKMSDAEWAQQRVNLGRREFERLTEMRSEWMSGQAKDVPTSVNTEALNSALNVRAQAMGIRLHPPFWDQESNKRMGNMQIYFTNELLNQQSQLGRKFNPKEITDFVNQQFAQPGVTNNDWFGDNNPKMLEMTADQIPDNEKAILASAFAQRGNKNPSDGELMRAYWGWKGKK